VHTEGPSHKYEAARQPQVYICLCGMDGDSFAICLRLYLNESCIESKLQLEMQSTKRLENCVLANMLEPTREGKWQAVWARWWTGQFLKMWGGSWLAEELWGSEGGLCCVGLVGWLVGFCVVGLLVACLLACFVVGCWFVSWLVGWL